MTKSTLDWTVEDFDAATKKLLQNKYYQDDVIEWIPPTPRPSVMHDKTVRREALKDYMNVAMSDEEWVLELGMEHAPFKTGAKVLLKDSFGNPVVGVIQPPVTGLNKLGKCLIKTAESIVLSNRLEEPESSYVGVSMNWEDVQAIVEAKDD